VFLGHLFHDVILADRVAMGASGSTTQANTLRRVLLASAAVLCLIFAIGFLASYGNNRRLESDAIQAASDIPAAELTPANLASVEALRKLETLRQSVERLGTYERQGAPMSFRWGLYTGTELYPELRKVYFKRFHQLLLLPIQSTMLHTLQTLPPTSGPPRGPTYETLKAYLITTSNHEKSTRLFLSPVLRDRWTAGRNVELERLQLAEKQFDFYAEELKAANPFSSENDTLAVERARAYLKRFGAIDSVYQFMLDEAGRNNPPISFHQVFPAAGQAVTDRKVVPGAFSKGGWAFMQNAFKDPSRFFSGEQWVMGELAATGLGTAEIDQLKKRYQQDFIAAWREFIKAGSVAKYANVQDANNKLKLLSGPQSPLLQLFSLVSKNTAVGVPEVENLFRASQSVVPPANADVPAGPSNQSYMTGLVSLQNMIDPLAAQSGVPPDTALAPITQQQQAAKGKVGEMALGFGNDPEATTVRQLLEAPITNLDAVFRGVPAQALNAGGQAFCAQFQALMRKYPFNANATEQADLQEVSAIFKPKDVALWKFYEKLQSVLPRQGPRFVPTPPPGITIEPRFINFLERAAGFSDALYPRGVPEPRLEFSLRPASPEVQTLRLGIEGQSFDFPGGAPTFRKYVWPGGVHELKLAVKMKDGNDYSFAGQGLWAVFQFFDETENWHTTGSISGLEWKVKTGRTGRIAATVRFELDMGGAPPVLQRGYLAGMTCVSTVAH
jgi:type VI secretion system protein ImpL